MSRVQINGFSMSAHQTGTNPLDQIAASIASDRALRLFKIQAMKVTHAKISNFQIKGNKLKIFFHYDENIK